jgi:NADPH:quinone reductase-like Zn-dependent oxidoreductase
MNPTEAWVLYRGEGDSPGPGELVREPFELGPLADDELLVEPIYATWESNMSHALVRHPVDVCRQRNEAKVVLGNGGLVRVLEAGRAVEGRKDGEVGIFYGGSIRHLDPYGYIQLAHGYDAPNTVGLLAKRTRIHAKNFVPIPLHSRFSLAQWAAFSLRYLTGWSNWRLASRIYRLQVDESDDPAPHVWGWGGGSTLASLELARQQGWQATMITSKPERIELLTQRGITPLDRRGFEAIEFDPKREKDPEFRAAYQRSERAFLEEVKQRTGGRGVAIFFDYIGTPVVRATLKALARQGVLSSAGWKHGMSISHLRAVSCIQRQVHVHTHYARLQEAPVAVQYAENTGWMPPSEADAIFAWDDVPRVAREFQEGRITSYFPMVQVNAI